MLNNFRAYSTGIVTKILLVLLVASFALWGAEDMFTRSAHNSSVATVGDEEISVDTFRREYTQQLEQVKRSLGANYSPDLVGQLGIPRYVLQRLVQQSLLAQEAARVGFRADDKTVAMHIKNDPMLAGQSGGFDKSRFDAILRAQGLSEKRYVEKIRRDISTDELLFSLNVPLSLKNSAVDALAKAQKQPRNVDIYRLSADAAGTITATEDALAAFHKEQAARYTTPEYRSISLLRFTATDAEKSMKPISKAAIAEYYTAHKNEYNEPEKRDVSQLLYSDEKTAKKAADLVESGKSFAEIAKTLPPTNADAISLGFIEKKDTLEQAADIIFSLKKDDASPLVQSPFGYHLFKVKSVKDPGVKSLEDASASIETLLKQQKLERALEDMTNDIEDALAGGSTLNEVAKDLKISLKQVSNFNRAGQDKNSADIELPKLDKLLDVAFKTDEKSHSSIITSKNGEYYILAVDSIAPEKLQPLASVKERVAADYIQSETTKKLSGEAARIQAALEKKLSAKDILSSSPLKKIASGDVIRSSQTLEDTKLPAPLVNAIFTAKQGELTAPIADKSGNYLLALVQNAHITNITPSVTETERDTLKKSLLSQMGEEIMMQYIRHLETQYPVAINQDAVNQLLSQADASR